MSSLDTYRKNAQRIREEISRLEVSKSRENKSRADLLAKLQRAKAALASAKSQYSVRSKTRDIQTVETNLIKVEKKISDFVTKIANQQKRLTTEEGKIHREEKRVNTKIEQERKKQESRQKQSLIGVQSTLRSHQERHEKTEAMLEKITKLPSKINVLFFAANPIDQNHLRLDEEVREITEKIRSSEHRDSVQLISKWAARPLDILQALNEHNPTIVHFSGHGSSNDEIIFQDENGKAKPVSKNAIVQTMQASSENLRLVFFNTCFSRKQAEELVEHIESAIGMKDSIGDEAARVFSAQFYSSIGFGKSVKQSFDQAKAALMLESIAEEDIPELFINSEADAASIILLEPD